MAMKKWGLSFLLLLNTCYAQVSEVTKKSKKISQYQEEIETAKTVFYTVQLLTGLLFAGVVGIDIMEYRIPSERIRLAGMGFVASSLVYNGFKGLSDIINDGKSNSKEALPSSGTLLGMASKKVLKLLYHSGEMFAAGIYIYVHGKGCYKGEFADGCSTSLIWVPLLTNGLRGFDKELEITKRIKQLRDKKATKTIAV
jgi:hypothetical protein